MNVGEYLRKKREREEDQPVFRKMCVQCRQPEFSCFCEHIKSFDPKIEFAILIHPLEARRRVATGRMAHLCLENSHLIEGHNYTDDERVNALIAREDAEKVILYPGKSAVNLTQSQTDLSTLFPPTKKLIIFVIDGTWATARQTMNVSRNLKMLPKICFTPAAPSQFRVRKQPQPECHSTIEAIHHTIDLFGDSRGFKASNHEHDHLLRLFGIMVEGQLELIRKASNPRRPSGKSTWRTKSRKKQSDAAHYPVGIQEKTD
ncbi:MAG: DTW domain-containing protein [Bdellovibrionaceae bacterium]|nr:DTW domain-containing protein [Pseudobdellovibrionaceae bacterium]